MNFSIKTEYALRAVYALAQNQSGKPLKREDMAESQNIPLSFLETILIALKKQGLVKSVKGPGGGYLLNKPIDQLNIWDIYSAVDYKDHEGVKCFPSMTKECERLSACKIKGVWFEFNNTLKSNMQSISLNSFAS